MDEYLAEKILKEYEIKCESNKRFPYLMLFNTVFTCFFLVLSCIYVFEMLLSGKLSFRFYVFGFFVIESGTAGTKYPKEPETEY